MDSSISHYLPEEAEDSFRFSQPVPLSLYVNHPEYFSVFQPRIHKNEQITNDATIQCQIDLRGLQNLGKVNGNMDFRSGNWTSLAFPEAHPDRIALLAYVMEAGFLLDDYSTSQQATLLLGVNTEDQCVQLLDNQQIYWVPESQIKKGLSKLTANLLEVDKILGQDIVLAWADWRLGEANMERKASKYESLEEYLSDRMEDVAWKFVMAGLQFGGGSCLTKEETTSIAPLCEPLYAVVLLTNDYFSWDKEYALHITTEEKAQLRNAVALYMEWHSVSAADAKAILRGRIVEFEKEYLLLKKGYFEANNKTQGVSLQIRQWLKALELILAGNLLWSITCPRYNSSLQNVYCDYYQVRCDQGAVFFDNCEQSSSILSGGNEVMIK